MISFETGGHAAPVRTMFKDVMETNFMFHFRQERFSVVAARFPYSFSLIELIIESSHDIHEVRLTIINV